MRYLVNMGNGTYMIGEKIQTRGNDEEYPTFEMEDGKLYSAHVDRIVTEIKDEGEEE